VCEQGFEKKKYPFKQFEIRKLVFERKD